MTDSIPGLELYPDWIPAYREERILRAFGDAGPRVDGTQRNRIVRLGPGVVASGYTDGVPVPTELHDSFDGAGEAAAVELGLLVTRIAMMHGGLRADAITVNYFLPGQGVDPHVDRDEAGPVIAVLSLQGQATMVMKRWTPVPREVGIVLRPRTLLVLRDEARWRWEHAILPVDEPRMSIVFRRALP